MEDRPELPEACMNSLARVLMHVDAVEVDRFLLLDGITIRSRYSIDTCGLVNTPHLHKLIVGVVRECKACFSEDAFDGSRRLRADVTRIPTNILTTATEPVVAGLDVIERMLQDDINTKALFVACVYSALHPQLNAYTVFHALMAGTLLRNI